MDLTAEDMPREVLAFFHLGQCVDAGKDESLDVVGPLLLLAELSSAVFDSVVQGLQHYFGDLTALNVTDDFCDSLDNLLGADLLSAFDRKRLLVLFEFLLKCFV